jgi:hypothetical protein
MEGSDNVLELTPVYRKRKAGKLLGLDTVTSFYEGLEESRDI